MMRAGESTGFLLAPIAALALAAILSLASAVFAPLALALFVIAMVWPLQRLLQGFMPGIVAACLCALLILAVIGGFGWLIAWGFGRVAHVMIADTARYQALYDRAIGWIEGHGIAIDVLW